MRRKRQQQRTDWGYRQKSPPWFISAPGPAGDTPNFGNYECPPDSDTLGLKKPIISASVAGCDNNNVCCSRWQKANERPSFIYSWSLLLGVLQVFASRSAPSGCASTSAAGKHSVLYYCLWYVYNEGVNGQSSNLIFSEEMISNKLKKIGNKNGKIKMPHSTPPFVLIRQRPGLLERHSIFKAND